MLELTTNILSNIIDSLGLSKKAKEIIGVFNTFITSYSYKEKMKEMFKRREMMEQLAEQKEMMKRLAENKEMMEQLAKHKEMMEQLAEQKEMMEQFVKQKEIMEQFVKQKEIMTEKSKEKGKILELSKKNMEELQEAFRIGANLSTLDSKKIVYNIKTLIDQEPDKTATILSGTDNPINISLDPISKK